MNTFWWIVGAIIFLPLIYFFFVIPVLYIGAFILAAIASFVSWLFGKVRHA